MSRLKSRQRYIPNGFVFYQPQTGWKSPRNASFEVIVNSLMAHRKANPHLAQKHNWNLAHDAIADELDEFNAAVCERMGWLDFVQAPSGGAPPPKFPAPSPSDQKSIAAVAGRVTKIWAGVRTLNDWIDSGQPAVPAVQSEARAATCATCPQNTKGDFTSWFTAPAAEAIRRQMQKLESRKLATPHDDKLGVCEACLCPLKLKVHTPFAFINAHLSEGVLAELQKAPNCWIIAERKA